MRTFAFMDLKKTPGTWDRGVDFEEAKTEFERILRVETDPVHYSNFATLLIQLVNGSRVSEAVEAFNEFLATGGRELKVRVRKRQQPTTEHREIRIPSAVDQRGNQRTVGAVKTFANRQGINTHSLRYAFISKLGRDGVMPQIIARITHHKKLDMILRYTQQRVADELLEELVK